MFFFFFKQKTAYEMRISDWSSDVCSSDLTLFGRNSTAGLINIVTKGPELGAFAGKGSLSYGNYDYWRVDGMINAPLGDKAALRVDGVWQQRDGFIDNATPRAAAHGLISGAGSLLPLGDA